MEQPARRRRGWRTFSLRTLFLAMTIVAIWFGLNANRAARQRYAVPLIKAKGGSVHYNYELIPRGTALPKHRTVVRNASGQIVSDLMARATVIEFEADSFRQNQFHGRSPRPLAPSWLRNTLGEDLFVTVTAVRLDRPDVTDGDLKVLLALANVRSLDLSRSAITDDGLKVVGRLTHLESLNLAGTRITDAGMRHLQGLGKLELLTLYDTQITGAAGAEIVKIPHLRSLSLSRTGMDNEDLTWIAAMADLEELNLSQTRVNADGLPALRPLTRLRLLAIDKVADEHVESLLRFEKLESLTIRQSRLSELGIQQLKAARPDLYLGIR